MHPRLNVSLRMDIDISFNPSLSKMEEEAEQERCKTDVRAAICDTPLTLHVMFSFTLCFSVLLKSISTVLGVNSRGLAVIGTVLRPTLLLTCTVWGQT